MNPRYSILCAFSALTGVWLTKKISITGILIMFILVIVIAFQLKRKAIIIFFLLPFFYFYSNIYNDWNSSSLNPESDTFQGIVDTIPEVDGSKLSFHFITSGEKVIVRYRVKSALEKNTFKHLRINMNCTVKGILKEPDSKRNFYGMDYREYLLNQKIYWILEPSDFHLKDCVSKSSKDWISIIKLWRSSSIKGLEEHLSPNTAGLMNALLFGYRNGIELETLEAYQRLGLTHLLAVSGFNVGIVSFFLFFLFVRMGIVKEAVYVLIIVFLPVYVIFTGGESSIVRAGIMGMLFFLFIMFRKKLNPAVVLSLVCISMLLTRPSYAFDLGFQLSFLMTFVLITSISLFQSKSFFHLLIKTSFMCSLFSFPIIIFHFYEFSIWSIPLNILYIPFVSFVLFPVSFFVYLLILFFPEYASSFKHPVQLLFESSASLIEFIQSLYGTILLGRPPIIILFLYFIALLFLFYKWERRGRIRIQYIVPFLMILVIQSVLPFLTSTATISFINVGQGDSILIELPYRKGVFLIDTGGTVLFEKEKWEMPEEEFDVTKNIVLSYLKARGIRKLNGLFLSHGDMDHAGGAFLLLDTLPIETLYMPNNKQNELEAEIKAKAKSEEVKVQLLNNGTRWRYKESQIFVMHPSQKQPSSNNQSVVLWAKIYDTSFLFTGDIEKEAEKEIADKFESFHADVLKAAHHGSLTSTTPSFLQKVSPEYAVISVGKHNLYGHPSLDVINTLNHNKIKIYRTDQNGDVAFIITKRGRNVITVN